MNPDNRQSRGRGRKICEFKTSLIHKVSSGTARVTQENPFSKNKQGWAWWCTPLILAFRRQRRQISEFNVSLVHSMSSRTARAT